MNEDCPMKLVNNLPSISQTALNFTFEHSSFTSRMVIFLLLLNVSAMAQINYPDFNTNGGSQIPGLNLIGAISIVNSVGNNVLRLTVSPNEQSGFAWFSTKQFIRKGFQTQFQFQITDTVGNGGDGFSFTLQNESSTCSIGNGGGGIGYVNIPNCISIEFDTHQNVGTPVNDTNDNHVSVNSLGTAANSADHYSATIGAAAIPIITMKDGNIHTVNIDYDVIPGTLRVFMDDPNELNAPLLSEPVDLTNINYTNHNGVVVNGGNILDNTGSAWVGFTAATGLESENHDILNWTLTSTDSTPQIAYLIPDIGTPDFNTYVEIIGPYNQDGNFGTDGIYMNNISDAVRVVCANPADTSKIVIGPVVVSQNGKMISTQLFVRPGLQPNDYDWQNLSQQWRVPIQVKANGNLSTIDTFYIVQPWPGINRNIPGAIGSGGAWGLRSRRGAMIVDSLVLNGTAMYTIDTSDCDPITPGNQGYLPAVILSKGAIIIAASATISVNGDSTQGGPGGGGGGGIYNDAWHPPFLGNYTSGGGGYCGGEGGGQWGGEGTGGYGQIDSAQGGVSLNGMHGGEDAPGASTYDIRQWFPSAGTQGTGGGSGFPFGKSGQGGYTIAGILNNTIGGYGGGSGADESNVGVYGDTTAFGGGGGGNATIGTSTTSGGGNTCGNNMNVPFCGGSGGAGGNPYFGVAGNGGGGGGAIVLYGLRSTIFGNISAVGADGGNVTKQNIRDYSGAGGGGAGGGILLMSKLSLTADSILVNGGKGGIATPLNPNVTIAVQNGGTGGAGRVRWDGHVSSTPNIVPNQASQYEGPSTDTSQYVARIFTLTGTGAGKSAPINIYLKAASGAWQAPITVSNYQGNAWSQQIELTGSDTLYYLVVAQQVPSANTTQFTMEPQWVLSQAATNILRIQPQKIASSQTVNFNPLVCGTTETDSLNVHNSGGDTLEISSSAFLGATASALNILEPSSFPIIIPPGDSVLFVLQFSTNTSTVINDTLSIANNDPVQGDNPWRIAINGIKNVVNLSVTGVSGDTLDFGTFCPSGTPRDTSIEVINSSSIATSFTPRIATPFALTGNPFSTPFAKGEIRNIPVQFNSPVAGFFIDSLVISDTCGVNNVVYLEARAASPNIAVPSLFDTTVCPFVAVSVPFPITNNDGVARAVTYTSSCALTKQSAILNAGTTDTLFADLPGIATGTETCTIHVTDECGVNHDIAATLNIGMMPPLVLSLKPITSSVKIDSEITVTVLATPTSSAIGSGITFTIYNDPTALHFDSVLSPCGASIIQSDSITSIMLSGCPDTNKIAILYYQTLAGSTLTPIVSLINESTANTCLTVSGTDTETISLVPPGCELGTVIVQPFTSSLQSVYPNPSTDMTTVTYSTVENANVMIELRDALGRTVRSIVNSLQKPGEYTATFDAHPLPDGMYFLMMREGEYRDANELLILK